MPMTKDQILAEAMVLPPADRQALADDLLSSMSEADCDALDAAWLAEARELDAAFARGENDASPVEEALSRILSRDR